MRKGGQVRSRYTVYAERAKIDKELALKELEIQFQAQASTSATVDQNACNRDAKSLKLPALINEKYE